MQPSLPDSRGGVLLTRVVSALVLAPPVLLAIYVGPPYSDILLVLAALLLGWEWGRICGAGSLGAIEVLLLAAVVAPVLAGGIVGTEVAGWTIALGAVGVALAATRTLRPGASAWFGLGVVYLALPLVAFQWIRQADAVGRDLTLWLLAVVWATDIGAYAAGRTFGGPKLLPRISPKKTWAGLLGGTAAATFVAVALAGPLSLTDVVRAGLLAALLAPLSQIGDFFESWVKRHHRLKDASDLIPGHGGLLDRVDGLIVATLVLALLVWLGQGPK